MILNLPSKLNKLFALFLLAFSLFPSGEADAQTASAQFVGADGLTVEKLIETATAKRGDLLAARQRVAAAEARILQARQRPNPTLDGEYSSAKILGGEPESELSVGVSQVFETNGKRSKRVTVAELELAQTRAEVLALERRAFAEIRAAYARAVSAARQLDVLESLQKADTELIRVTEARLTEGDVAPLDANLVRVESDRLRVQTIETKAELETAMLELKTLAGFEIIENFKIAPQAERPPRLDLSLAELTNNALQNRADLQAARLAEELGTARINLSQAGKTPDVAASVRYTREKEIFDFPASVGGSLTEKTNSLSFGVSVEIPVFNRKRGEIAVATAEREQAKYNREFLEASVKRDVAVAYRKYRTAAEKLVLYATQILPRSEENLRSVRAAYGLGDFTVFDVVAEQRRLTESVTGYNAAVRDYYSSLVELETALGAPLPVSAFAPSETSVLPEKSVVPNQIERGNLLQSLFEKPNKENK